MNSIKEIFKIGFGPSSSHTMGPAKAAEEFLKRVPAAEKYKVILYGSLAATGKGHFTDVAIRKKFSPKDIDIEWQPNVFLPEHPNGMEFFACHTDGSLIRSQKYFSIGGGDISVDGKRKNDRMVYPLSTMKDILDYLGSM